VAEYTTSIKARAVLLIAQEANYSLDETDGRGGFLYRPETDRGKSEGNTYALRFGGP